MRFRHTNPSPGDGKPRYFIDDVEVSKAEYERRSPKKGRAVLSTGVPQGTVQSSSKAWPRVSRALGVHPKQKKKAEAESIRLGVPTEFDSKGNAILLSTAHQRDLQKALSRDCERGQEVVNLDGGYGQITG